MQYYLHAQKSLQVIETLEMQHPWTADFWQVLPTQNKQWDNSYHGDVTSI